ncbi:MAG: hypothetical protein KDD40_02270 [Bdellovibrionales bacterium]|nr:hypothetical protein [Bdellovibrionales bacterium]
MKNLSCIILAFTLVACASPQIYVIDRQTVMEAEAAGDWPIVESDLLKVSEKSGPTFFARDTDNKKDKRLHNILNGELKN